MVEAKVFEGTNEEIEEKVAAMLDEGWSVENIGIGSANRIIVLFIKT